jgi:hypothetical protein
MHRLQKNAIIFCAVKKIEKGQKEQSASKWKENISETIRSESGKMDTDLCLLYG